tara:strand:+ start:1239 stop:1565 length:327 start_codon:yes stop_codon:yes gene_type:complete
MSSFKYIDVLCKYDGPRIVNKVFRQYTDERICNLEYLEEVGREYDEEKNEYVYSCLYYTFIGPLHSDLIILKAGEWTQEKENKIINNFIHKHKPGLLRRLADKISNYF